MQNYQCLLEMWLLSCSDFKILRLHLYAFYLGWTNRIAFLYAILLSCLQGLNPYQRMSIIQIYKAQRNVILCVSACLLYWYVGIIRNLFSSVVLSCVSFLLPSCLFLYACRCIYRICKYHKDIESLEDVEKRYKDQ